MKKGQVHIEEDEIEGYVPDVPKNKIDDHSQLALVSPEAWRQAYKLAGLAGEYADRMRRRAAEAVDVAEDFEARCAKAKGVARRTAHIVEITFSKRQNSEEQEEDGKKQMATSQEEARKRNDEEARKRQRAATSGRSTSSTERNEQQQRQQRLRPRPPDYPPPRLLATQSVKRSPPSWICKK